jgi:tetratricopeptide (TPR) repeat protein
VQLTILLMAFALVLPEDQQAAQQHLERGVALLHSNRFDDAIVEFQAGYALVPSPAFLFNLGLGYEAAKRKREALESYDKFIKAVEQDATGRPDLLESLETARRNANALRAAGSPLPAFPPVAMPRPPPLSPEPGGAITAPAPPRAEAPEKPSRLKWWLIGAGGLLAGAAATWFVVARKQCPGQYDIGCL